MRFSYVADHWQYLSLIGLVCLMAALLDRVKWWLPFALVPLFLVLTVKQSALYASEETIWRDTLVKNPGAWLAENGLGVIEMQSNRRESAIAHFQNVIRSKPDYVEPYINMGVIHLGQSDDAHAAEYFLKALQIFPGNARALNNMAALALRHGEPDVAIHYLEEAVLRLPTYSLGYKNLGIVLLKLKRVDEAKTAFQKALQLRSDDEEAAKYLAILQSGAELH
jgi:Tfp pilus assembly protein PilF